MHEFDDKPSKDKWTGVKKYCLKMLGKIAARAKMPAQVCGEVQADVLRLFGGDTVEAVLREAAQECLVALKKVEETAKW
ncbi:hypothetical protein HK097_006908 [Rhizophlyctis rosea]|uniref:Uncharacterized protein n=1 Tax=Rhizophlyctis rosea TaxID=64517 RepID=A0AAD5SDT7_9FUNG|nr:hypothetical protein HK097_006908 [Rhizophlyctis rosea]